MFLVTRIFCQMKFDDNRFFPVIPDRKQQLQALNLLIILLNDVHRDSLKLLLKFLGRVVAKEEVNKMSLNNVAMIMAPNLFMARKSTKVSCCEEKLVRLCLNWRSCLVLFLFFASIMVLQFENALSEVPGNFWNIIIFKSIKWNCLQF